MVNNTHTIRQRTSPICAQTFALAWNEFDFNWQTRQASCKQIGQLDQSNNFIMAGRPIDQAGDVDAGRQYTLKNIYIHHIRTSKRDFLYL